MPDTRLHTGSIWPEITKAARTRGPRAAAIAYLGGDAPSLLPLRKGDLLVCDASDTALLAHATNPDALEGYLNAGVTVRSCPQLHAKMIVTSHRVVIGSANASTTSTMRYEAAVISDDPALIAAARSSIATIGNLTDVDKAFLIAAHAAWERGAPTRHPGQRPPTEGGLFPPRWRLRLIATDPYHPTATEEAARQKAARSTRRAVGPAAAWALDAIFVPADDPLRIDDMFITTDGTHVHPPEVVVQGPLRTRGRQRLFITKRNAAHQPLTLDEARDRLTGSGVRLGRESYVRSPEAQAALFGLWGLTPPAPSA